MSANGLPVLVAGDTYTVSLVVGALAYADVYAEADGWTFAAQLAGPGTARAAATRARDGVVLTIPAAATAQLAPGRYRVTLAAARGAGETAERRTLGTWALVVAPDPAGGLDPRHPDERALAAAYLRRDELLADSIKQYAVGGSGGQRQVVKRDLIELRAEIKNLERRIAARRAAAAGVGPLDGPAFGFPSTVGAGVSGGASLQTAGVTRVGVFR